ncbi:MAG: translation initiation factor IF-2 [Planctomycetes bacterium]|nr:translation initiation factor IF-2 [Planctomycetota bacterium]
MATKTATIRVFQMAKDIGVTSKDIIAKCQAEGIENITNHMSAVSRGLAATVREWFGEGQSTTTTAIETAAPVDVAKARAKVKKKATRKKSAKTVVAEAAPKLEEELTPETVPVAAPPESGPVDAPPSPVAAPLLPTVVPEPLTVAPDTLVPPPAPEEPVIPALDPALAPAAQAPEPSQDLPRMNIPDRPPVIAPAGRMLAEPTQTKLAGPRIIRVESPEVVAAPRPASRPETTMRRSGPRAGRGVGTPLPEAPASSGDPARTGRGAASRRNKRRTTTDRDQRGRVGRTATGSEQPQRSDWTRQDLLERDRRLTRSGGFFKAHRRDNLKRTIGAGHRAVSAAEVGGFVKIQEPITIKTLSAATGVKAADIVRTLFLAGNPTTVNSIIDGRTAAEVMLEYNIELEVLEQKTAQQQIIEQFLEREVVDERPRNPVITILGHVDHGKTSLLDRIRNTNVAESEAGGITQATSAFQVPVRTGDKERLITFIDTPGHEAFTDMRARGASVTDLVVLVVAADDGVMPQTVESINHAKAAQVTIVIALNKIDKPEATDVNLQRIYGQLAEHELAPPEWGGSTDVVKTSALKNEGIQDLLDVLDYQADLLELKADFGGMAEGTVLEARLQEGRGPVANLLVQRGCLKKGDFIVVGRASGRIRDIVDDHGKRIDEAGPSMPVVCSGISEVPDPGDRFYVVTSLKDAEAAAQERRDLERDRDLVTEKITLDNIFERMSADTKKVLPLIIKGDVQGSVDTLKVVLEKISTDEVMIAVKHAAVGGVNESDVLLAKATGAIIIGFNVTSSVQARRQADERQIDIRLYDVIYDVTDDVIKAAEGLLDPEHKLEVIGHAEVREVYKISRVGMIAGCYVTDGVIERNALIRVTRGDIVVEKDRKLDQLKRFKDDAKEVRTGQECGMKIEAYDDIKVGDVLECYKKLEVRRTL